MSFRFISLVLSLYIEIVKILILQTITFIASEEAVAFFAVAAAAEEEEVGAAADPAAALDLFLMMVSPSAVTIFLGQRFSLVCLMRPLRYVNRVPHCWQL